jgi:hypothetical protein
MALVSGPTVGKAISDPKCALPALALTDLSESDMIQEIYMRVLSRPAQPKEIEQIITTADQIVLDHAELEKRLNDREKWWGEERPKRESVRLAKLEDTKKSKTDREQAIAADRQKMEAEQKLAAAEEALKKFEEDAATHAGKWLTERASPVTWFPAAPATLASTNGATLTQLADRSIRAAGKEDKTTYTLTFRTPLRNIRGLRLEALADETLKGNGPGVSDNGNFVVTEIEVDASPLGDENAKKRFAFASAKADFSQDGFGPDQVIDGGPKDQRGWAVNPRMGTVHWMSLQTKEPIDFEGGSLITVAIHQYHDAAKHRLGRFRISFAIDQGDIPLGLPEEFVALSTIPEKSRTPDTLKSLFTYLRANDKPWQDALNAVATAKQPLPEDEQVVAFRNQITALEVVTPDDPRLLQLRTDFEASKLQIANRRLTLAQDLTWALINSPAFLFNH